MDAAVPPTARTRGPRIVTSLIVGGLGLVVGIVGVVLLVVNIVDYFDVPTRPAPGEYSIRLEATEYDVYELTGNAFGSDSLDRLTIGPDAVTVTSPTGQDVPVRESDHSSYLGRDDLRYRSTASFDAPTSGVYTIRVDSLTPTRVIIAQSVEDRIKDVLPWVGLIVLGGLLFLLGIILLLVGIVRRSNDRKRAMTVAYATVPGAPVQPVQPVPPPAAVPSAAPAEAEPTTWPTAATDATPAADTTPAAPPPAGPPADWYPDPGGQYRLRYWDGTQWTEHVSN